MSLRVYPVITVEGNILDAERILVRHTTETLDRLGRELREDVIPRMREFRGLERKSVKFQVSGRGLNKLVEVYSTLIQAFVDEYGLPPGVFPPWDIGSNIYRYVERKGLHRLSERRQFHNFNVRRRPRKVSHVTSRRPSSKRAGGSGRGAEGLGQPRPARTRSQARQAHRARVKQQSATRSRASITNDRAIRRVAFLIARSIFERGIRAGRPFALALEANRERVISELQQAFVRAVAEINR